MALINCPECGKQISDKAEKCVHCGCKLVPRGSDTHMVKCADCGIVFASRLGSCPKCGRPVESEMSQDYSESGRYDSGKMENCKTEDNGKAGKVIDMFNGKASTGEYMHETQGENAPVKKKTKWQKFWSVFSIVCLIIAGLLVYDYVKHEQYYNNVSQAIEIYNETIDDFNYSKDLLMDVWHHAIFDVADKKTDKFVRPNGVFVDDFNDALDRLYKDKKYNSKLDNVYQKTEEMKEVRKKLLNPPRDLEEYNEYLLKYIDTDIEMNLLLISPSGSYKSLNDDFNEMIDDLNSYSRKMDILS